MKSKLLNLIIFFVCLSCMPTRPVSTHPGAISISTGLPFNVSNNFEIEKFDGFLDQNVILYPDLKYKNRPKAGQEKVYIPNVIKVNKDLYVDEVETTNLNWREFLFYIKRDSSNEFYQEMLPAQKDLPKDDYLFNDFYRFFPVVGINHYQAKAYLIWRTKVVNNLLKQMRLPYKITYRLPTEEEWENAASGGLDKVLYPTGLKNQKVRIKINPKSAQYLIQLNELQVSEEQLIEDIKKYNQNNPEILGYLVQQNDLPYFLQFKTPFYIFNPIINQYALINMIGNVAEMTDKDGVVKGGSYKNNLIESEIPKRALIQLPAPNVGFRAVAEINK